MLIENLTRTYDMYGYIFQRTQGCVPMGVDEAGTRMSDDHNPAYEVPPEIRSRLSWVADHVLAARRDCVGHFIDDVLLERMRDPRPMTALELQRLAFEYKSRFQADHPGDFDADFEIIPAAEIELIARWDHDRRAAATTAEVAAHVRLVRRAARRVKRLLDKNAEELFGI